MEEKTTNHPANVTPIFIGEQFHDVGFRLAGIQQTYRINQSNAQEIYQQLKDTHGLFILTPHASKMLTPYLEKMQEHGLVVTLPQPEPHTQSKKENKTTPETGGENSK